MRPIAIPAVVVMSAVLLTACSSSTSTRTATPVATAPTATPATTSAASTAPIASAAPTSLDPCQLVTASEASALASASYQTGKEETNKGGGKECVYGSQTTNVFTVIVGQATSPAVAQAEWSAVQAQAKEAIAQKLPAGVHASLDTANVANLGDRAATVYGATSIEGQKVGFSGVLRPFWRHLLRGHGSRHRRHTAQHGKDAVASAHGHRTAVLTVRFEWAAGRVCPGRRLNRPVWRSRRGWCIARRVW